MTAPSTRAASQRLLRTHIPDRADQIGESVRAASATSLRAPAYAQQLLSRWWVDDLDFIANRVTELRRIHDWTIEYLRRVPYLKVEPAQATAYFFPDVSALGLSDQQIAARLQRDAKLIVSPGYQFGPSGVGHFRICYARDETRWAEALDTMVGVLNTLGKEQGLA